ncbi:hypothetical protein Lal_00008026 [Lupinus albus]|nr:hypothetical protein Lal_00008026 [Lupinus albus]
MEECQVYLELDISRQQHFLYILIFREYIYGLVYGHDFNGSIFLENVDCDYKSSLLIYQPSDSRLSERFSLERERFTWEGEILGYTGGFSPERELSRLGEKCHFGAVATVRFSLERESLA